MRDLTEEELKLAPAGCDHYNIVDGNVYFTDIFGIEVFDSRGVEVNNCIMGNMVFAKSVPLPSKPFDIKCHNFSDDYIVKVTLDEDIYLHLEKHTPYIAHSRGDVIAMAKALGVTAKDLS